MCIDDFALKKRYRYGSILVDIETGRIVDLIESREAKEVTAWLKQYPNITLVCRDGARAYSKAITAAHPQAIHVTDRFHLIARLIEISEKIMYKQLPSRVPVILTEEEYSSFEDFLLYASRRDKILYVRKLKNEKQLTEQEIRMETGFSIQTIRKYSKMEEADIPEDKMILRERDHQATTEAKKKRVEEVKKLYESGVALQEICDMTGITFNTIKRYLEKTIHQDLHNMVMIFQGSYHHLEKK